MTSRERAHKLLDKLPDEQVDDALAVLEAIESGRVVDEWGDLSKFGDALMGDTLRRLDEQERAEFGETIAEAWGREPKRDS